jgi:hypothetical protein
MGGHYAYLSGYAQGLAPAVPAAWAVPALLPLGYRACVPGVAYAGKLAAQFAPWHYGPSSQASRSTPATPGVRRSCPSAPLLARLSPQVGASSFKQISPQR